MKVTAFIDRVGRARFVMLVFLAFLIVMTFALSLNIQDLLSNALKYIGMNAFFVLSMLVTIKTGTGLNFGLPLGLIAGMFAGVLSLEWELTGWAGFMTAIAIAIVLGAGIGYVYGRILNRVKGSEMMIATYVGFSSVAFMSIMWLLLPYHSPTMVWGYSGSGLRTTISTDGFYSHVLKDFLQLNIGTLSISFGEILFFAIFAFIIWAFLHTKTGTAMTAVGSNPVFARAAGINVDKQRTLSVIMSTWLGALGILCYQQGYGFIQLYQGPMYMAMPAVSAILIGGASVNKASIANVIIGTILYQGIVTMTPSVMNNLIHTDMSEVLRIIVSNGMILYALTRKSGASR